MEMTQAICEIIQGARDEAEEKEEKEAIAELLKVEGPVRLCDDMKTPAQNQLTITLHSL
jgi:hypothetical protein